MDDEPITDRRPARADQQPADVGAFAESTVFEAFEADEQEWLLGAGDHDLDWSAGAHQEGWPRRIAQLGAVVGGAASAAINCFERIQPAVVRAWARLRPAIHALAVLLAVILWRLRMFVLHAPEADHQPMCLPRLSRLPHWRVPAMRLPQLRVVGSPRWRMKLLIVAAMICLLLACALPPLGAIGGALDEYATLRALGDSGVRHLLAAKQYLQDLSESFDLGELQQALAPTTAAASRVPYTYVIQRQAGTDYGVTVTVHPAPHMVSQGFTDAQLQATINANTSLRYGDLTPESSTTPAASAAQGSNAGALRVEQASSPPARTVTLHAIGAELRAAQTAFATLSSRLGKPDWMLRTANRAPDMKTQLIAIAALAETGYDIATVGIELYDAAMPLLTRMGQGALSSQGDLVTPTDLDALQHALTHATQSIDSIQTRLGKIDLRALPLSQQQIALFTKQMAELPTLRDAAQQFLIWLPALGWILGVGQPRHFLVQTLDRTELRPSGGFTGDYGVLTLGNGRLDPFALYNINDIEYGYKNNGYIYGRHAPNEYSWWPFSDFGLRDSNLSADFPTTAKINMNLFKVAGQGDVDGVIQITPTLIAHLLRVTGPIYVPGYDETVTADNLEQRIEFYQQDPRGIAIEQRLNPTDHTHSLRKRFTQLVTQLLQDKVKHLGESQLLSLARQLVDDLKSKNLQVYVTNTQVEDLLSKLHAAGAMETPPGADTYMLVQANVSVAKSTPYVQLAQTDDVTLDDQGGATHRLTITMNNNPTGPIYGYPTYRDYLRVYVPATARFTGGWGFDQMYPMCYTPAPPPPAPPAPPAPTPTPTPSASPGPSASPSPSPSPSPTPTPTPTPPPAPPRPPQYAGLPDCPANPYSSADRACPASYYAWDGEASKVLGWDDNKVPALDTIGPPTNTTSDLPGFAMRGGYVMIPRFCTARVTLRWYVPNVVHPRPQPAGQHGALSATSEP